MYSSNHGCFGWLVWWFGAWQRKLYHASRAWRQGASRATPKSFVKFHHCTFAYDRDVEQKISSSRARAQFTNPPHGVAPVEHLIRIIHSLTP